MVKGIKGFQKGYTPCNKGIPLDKNSKEHLRKVMKGRVISAGARKKQSETIIRLFKEGKIVNIFKGKKRSIENCEKISETRKDRIKKGDIKMPIQKGKTYEEIFGKDKAKEIISKKVIKLKGKKHSLEQIENIKKALQTMTLFEKEKWAKKISETKKEQFFLNPTLKERMREARAKQVTPVKDTSIEVKIQNFLKSLGIEFFTHQRMIIEHGYQCDIFIPARNMVIECDGNYWHKYPIGREIDHIRTSELLQKGFKVLRLWEFEIKKMDLNAFQEKLK